MEEDSIKSHIAYLADDRMKGRMPGTPEYKLAIDYVIRKYQELNLLPGVEGNSYLQNVELRRGLIDPDKQMLTIKSGKKRFKLEAGKDFLWSADLHREVSKIEAPLVFAGYGIYAPELGHNDFKNIDVKGKIILIFAGAPETMEATERAHFSNLRTKYEMANQQGAVGVIMTSQPGRRSNFTRLAGRLSQGRVGIIDSDGAVDGSSINPFSSIKLTGFYNWHSLDKIMQFSSTNGKDLLSLYQKQNKSGLDLNCSLSAKNTTRYQHFTSYNVVGILPGSDTELRNEYVVHTAHLDHVGVGIPFAGDSIYNGAHDNASGVASCLEIARLYTRLPSRPARSIVFVMVTAEEMGLLGSLHFAKNPTVPKEQIVANLNTDMPTLIAPLLSIEPLGAKHSSLMDPVRQAAEFLHLQIMEDHMPEQVRFVRSDHYNFVIQGIPSLHVKYGLKALNPNEDLTEKIMDYTRNIYHKPSDELNDLFDFKAGKTYVQLNFLISYLIAQNPNRPTWNADSFFARYAK